MRKHRSDRELTPGCPSFGEDFREGKAAFSPTHGIQRTRSLRTRDPLFYQECPISWSIPAKHETLQPPGKKASSSSAPLPRDAGLRSLQDWHLEIAGGR